MEGGRLAVLHSVAVLEEILAVIQAVHIVEILFDAGEPKVDNTSLVRRHLALQNAGRYFLFVEQEG